MFSLRINVNCECYSLIIVFTATLSIDPYGQHGFMLQHKNVWCNYVCFTLVLFVCFFNREWCLTGGVWAYELYYFVFFSSENLSRKHCVVFPNVSLVTVT